MVQLRCASARMEEPMLRKEQNEVITQTGPGTPLGQLFSSYWTPALLAEELPENDSPPVRVKLLSERLVAFRDSPIAPNVAALLFTRSLNADSGDARTATTNSA